VNASTGELLGEVTVDATDTGHAALLAWGREVASARRWAVEDVRHVSGRLQHMLLGAGEDVVAVPPKLMAGVRRSARERGKSDAIDARAVALAALREPDLPAACTDETARELKILLGYREALVVERTRAQARVRWLLHELGMGTDIPAGSLDRPKWLRLTARRLASRKQTAGVVVAKALLRQIGAMTKDIRALEPIIGRVVEASHPQLLSIPGCGPLTAAKLVAEIGTTGRFSSDAKLAMHAGVAPIPCSSGQREHYRLNRSGNRQLNLAVHRIALTQSRIHEPARTYLERRQADGLSRREAMRCLKRHIVRRVYNVMKSPRPLEGLT
jgi:transposase